MEKILSISIAAYNAGKFIEECLDSVLEEKILDDLEVLIVNDGSTDNTRELVQPYVEKYPGTFRMIDKENGGWGSTVNVGMRQATGKYFKLLDADDWFYTENLVEYIDFLKKVDCDLVLTPYGKYDEDIKKVYSVYKYDLNQETVYDLDDMADKIAFQMYAMTAKMSVIRENMIDILDHCFYTDVQFVLELCDRCKTMQYKDVLVYKYRVGRGGQSCSREGYIKHHEDHRRVTEYLMKYYHEHDLSEPKKRAWESRVRDMTGAQYLIYSYIKDDKRVERMKEWDERLKQEPQFYDVISKEARMIRNNNYKNIDLIDGCFEFMRKFARKFGVDL